MKIVPNDSVRQQASDSGKRWKGKSRRGSWTTKKKAGKHLNYNEETLLNEQEEDSSVERDGEEGKAPITISTHCFLFVGTSFVLSSRTIKTYAGLVGKNEPFRAEGKKGGKARGVWRENAFLRLFDYAIVHPRMCEELCQKEKGLVWPIGRKLKELSRDRKWNDDAISA